MNDTVSVIIGMYNAEKYIARCVASVAGQLYKNLEIILVDNNSSDGTYQICEELAKRDGRIKLITEKKQGANYARYAGFKNCAGKYVMFADSDDWIDADTVSTLCKAAEENEAEIVKCNYIIEYENGQFLHNCGLIENETVCGERLREYILGIFVITYHFNPIWGQLIRKDILKDEYFEDVGGIMISEDYLINAHMYAGLKRFRFVPGYFYHYNMANTESITATMDFERLSKCLRQYWRVNEKIFNIIEKSYELACKALVAKFINETQDMVTKMYRFTLDEASKIEVVPQANSPGTGSLGPRQSFSYSNSVMGLKPAKAA